MERFQFIAALLWMIGMLVFVIWAMRDLIRSENEEHRQRQGPPVPTTDKAAEQTSDKH
jgi:flagellar biogenesis protein FliO